MTDQPSGCTVTVCRDCCCRSLAAGPDTQLDQLRTALSPHHRIRTSLCLDVCAQANVIVVHPTAEHRRSGARPVWFGLVRHDEITDDLIDWIRSGGPGAAPVPPMLELSVIRPPADR